MPYSYCGQVYCSETTICGNLPYEAHWAICGWCICGQVICGDIPPETSITRPERRSSNAILKIFKESGSIYTLDLVSASITLNNPSSDSCSIRAIDYNAIDVGDRIQVWIGNPSKFVVYSGRVVRLTSDESGVTSADIESDVEILKYKYLHSDKSFTDERREDLVEEILNENHAGLTYSLETQTDLYLKITRDYWAWDKTIWEILLDVYWDHNIYYVDKTLYVTSPQQDIGLTLNYYGGTFTRWSKTEEQGDQFGLIRVDGSDHYIEKKTFTRGEKEALFGDMTLQSQSEVNRVADILADEYNEPLYEVEIGLSYIFPPRFGLVHVKLPGLDEYLIIKEINYEVSGTIMETSLRLGSHRNPISEVLSNLLRDRNKVPFIF